MGGQAVGHVALEREWRNCAIVAGDCGACPHRGCLQWMCVV
jgi:hypothetical protein